MVSEEEQVPLDDVGLGALETLILCRAYANASKRIWFAERHRLEPFVVFADQLKRQKIASGVEALQAIRTLERRGLVEPHGVARLLTNVGLQHAALLVAQGKCAKGQDKQVASAQNPLPELGDLRVEGHRLGVGFFQLAVFEAFLRGLAGKSPSVPSLLPFCATLTDLAGDQYVRFREAFGTRILRPSAETEVRAHSELYFLLLALHQALRFLKKVSRTKETGIGFPKDLNRALARVKAMRNHYEHIDERISLYEGTAPSGNETAFEFDGTNVRFLSDELDLAKVPDWLHAIKASLVAWVQAQEKQGSP